MRTRIGAVLGLLMVLTLVAGCGKKHDDNGVATANNAKPGASAAPSASARSEQQQMLDYAKCMREHGIPMPDPEVKQGGGTDLSLPEGTDPSKAQAAMSACKQFLPNGGEPVKADPAVVEAQRKFAKCMRDNGITAFPDPDPDGGIRVDGNQSSLDPADPAFKAAEKACKHFLPPPPSGQPDAPMTNSVHN